MPTPDDELESEGQPALYSAPPGQDVDLDQDPPVAPADRPQAVTGYGTTAAEQRTDEPLFRRVRREEPEVDSAGHGGERDPVAARVFEPDSEIEEVDVTAEELGLEAEAQDDSAGLSAEEQAMHIVPDDRL